MSNTLVVAGVLGVMIALIALITLGLARVMRISRRSLVGLDALTRRPDLTRGEGP
jgi:flagellar biogenesis protein FliO